MTRRTLHLSALIVTGMLLACAALLLVVSREAEGTFPGKNGKIAYQDEYSLVIYTINPNGSAKTKVANPSTGGDTALDYSPDGKKIAYSTGKKIYTRNVGGGGKSKVTEGSNLAWGSRP